MLPKSVDGGNFGLSAAVIGRMPVENGANRADFMSQLNDVIEQSVRAQDAHFLVAMVGDKDGIKWSGAAGERAPGQKAAQDTVFRIFSMTKAIGSTAAILRQARSEHAR
jgi:CubicO group peptidase (beta-lactamase class C family)